ncbi:MAG: helix-turn-helix transcriptional regulator [Clostridia bacterium]|nr:helix-turn-helix transcriptional regulator [Clostridia bacterium]
MYKNLETIRKEKNLTINDMAKVINRSPANYFKKERGEVSITVKEAVLLAKFLNEDVEFLFQEYGKEP